MRVRVPSQRSPFAFPVLSLDYPKLCRVMFFLEEVSPADLVDAYLLRFSVDNYYGLGGEAPFY